MNRAFNRRKDKSGGMTSPEALAKNHIAYSVKFLGVTDVDQPKGTDVVRVAVRKLKFQRHIKKSEGHKTQRVELQVSIYGVKLLDPKTRDVLHNCQLHRISFCADDKTDKRIFTFICTEPETKTHLCYVFDSEKCAEEITVTIGRTFDLAYRKFLESGGKDVETRKQISSLQKRIQELETENSKLKERLQDIEEHMTGSHASPAGSLISRAPPTDIFDMVPFSSGTACPFNLLCLPALLCLPPPPPPPPFHLHPYISPPLGTDLFGAAPFDPFMCNTTDFPPDIQSKLDEMQEGFNLGLTLEGAVFSLDPMDSRY
uniref:PTB domain-containing engulfment adapter protein 1 n=1 Tax=Esox lucius TaxID=8010 RepID=A0AAY5KE16_ESOLU